MSAKKKRPDAKRAKAGKAKTGARKALKARPAKKVRAKAPAKRPVKAAKPAVKAIQKAKPAPQAVVASSIKVKPIAAKPPANAKSKTAKVKVMKPFDPDRRRELIAAAAARRRKNQIARIAPVAIIQPRPQSQTERHRFSVGDEVRVISTSGMWFKHGVDYRITAALPPQAGKLQYRIKNAQEPFERVVAESQLAAPASHASF